MKTSAPHRRPNRRCAGFVHPELLLLLGLLPAAGYLFHRAEQRRLHDARRFAGPRGAPAGDRVWRRAGFLRIAAVAALIILALARPCWKEVHVPSSREGRDVVFLLDVSRSMLAQDLAPNRLGAAKTAIRDCVESLEGDRVGLVVFAGSTSILCPLTTDYDFFFDKLEEAHPDFVAPGDVRVGGTRIGDAIHKICDKLFTPERRGYQDLVLLSDGGDQESNPRRAAQRLDSLGVHFLVAGLGDAVTGARVPARPESAATSEFVLFQGREVWSRLEAQGLETVARSCRYGVFLNAGTRALPLGDIYRKLAAHFQRHRTGHREDLMQRQEMFPLFVGLALLCLVLPPWRRGASRSGPGLALACALGLAGQLLVPAGALGSTGSALFQHGLQQLAARNFTGSLESFRAAAEALPGPEQRACALYNAGVACYRQARVDEVLDPLSSVTYYRQSCACFRAALEMLPSLEQAAWNLELALRRLAMIPPEDLEQPDRPKQPEGKAENPDKQQQPAKEKGDEKAADKTEQDRTTQPSNRMDGQNAMDLNAQDIPPPTMEPEDVFQQERESDEVRQKTSGTHYKPVEKDW